MSDESTYDKTTIYIGSDEGREVVDRAREIIKEMGYPRSFSEWVRIKCEELVLEHSTPPTKK